MLKTKSLKKIVIFPGFFDPLHKQHWKIAETTIDDQNVAEFWFWITGVLPNKKPRLKFTERRKILELQIKAIGNLKIKVLSHPSPACIIPALKQWKKSYPNHSFERVIGGDNIEKITKWGKCAMLGKKLAPFLAVEREGYRFDIKLLKKYDIRVLKIDPKLDSSSMFWYENKIEFITNQTLEFLAKIGKRTISEIAEKGEDF